MLGQFDLGNDQKFRLKSVLTLIIDNFVVVNLFVARPQALIFVPIVLIEFQLSNVAV
jgi:hypothetical protein